MKVGLRDNDTLSPLPVHLMIVRYSLDNSISVTCVSRTRGAFGVVELKQAPLVLSDVTNGGGDEYFSTSLHGAETNVNWKLRTIFAPTVQFKV